MLSFVSDVKFIVMVPEADVAAFKKDLARSELNLSAEMELNDISYSISIYSELYARWFINIIIFRERCHIYIIY